ncbi:TOMM precursor leader peptide-binding protein [Micromonospora sp. NPDC049274]|uniref:TOMM precursor leader peptide-binding protein n=1 Tax=Micromonospora sp. NPDC049274 TaxID=3154829 RepID=UPI0034490F9C
MTGVAEPSLVGFRRHLRPEVVAGEATYLFSEHGVTAVQAARMEHLTPLLDGTRDVATVLREAPEECAGLVRDLAEAGLLVARTPAVGPQDPRAVAYWESAGLDSDAATSALTGAAVRVQAVGGVDDTAVREACATAGLTLLTGEGAADLDVVLCSDYLDAELAAVNRRQSEMARTWLLARPVGTQLWIGPVLRPGQACWHCLAHRLWLHRRAEAYVQRVLGRIGPVPRPVAAVPPSAAVAAQLVALEATKWLAGHRYAGQQAVWTVDTLTLDGRHHELRARPQCPSCGDPQLVRERTRRPVTPVSRPKASTDGGGHRALSPGQVWQRYEHLVSPVTGLVREVRRDTHGPEFLHSYRAGANLALDVRGLDDLRRGLRSEHGGKGATAEQARVSALCEALERQSGTFHGDELRIRARFAELGDEAVHPNSVQLFDDRQYADRAAWNTRHSAFQYVGPRFDEQAELDWTPVWSLTAGRQRLLPTALLYYGTPAESSQRCLRADSNGNAAGASLEDAICQGFFELVERDAVALWWYNRTRQPGVDLDAFADGWMVELRRVHHRLHREVWALDLTADLGVPTFVALSRRTDKPAEDIVFGFGAHLDPAVALRRALTEVNQLLPAVVEVDAQGAGYACDDPEARRWWASATVANQQWLRPNADVAARTPADYGYVPGTDLRDDIRTVQRAVAAHGLELLVLDQTRPDIGLPVVKVLVPGLRHFWARFAPGRLYDLPVQLGRVDQATRYEDLNPIPIFV